MPKAIFHLLKGACIPINVYSICTLEGPWNPPRPKGPYKGPSLLLPSRNPKPQDVGGGFLEVRSFVWALGGFPNIWGTILGSP